MFWEYPLKVQSWSTSSQDWYTTTFESEDTFTEFIQNQFKEEPWMYRLSNTLKWKETGEHYTKTVTRPNFEGGKYHDFVPNSLQHKKWKETERERILNGVIYDGVYVPPFYYWYLNYCPIYDDILKKKRFADVWDGDLWYMQYVMLAILLGMHVGGVKGRQKGYSYKHMAILYWGYSWFENSVNTIGAYDEKLVKKSWRFLEGYRSHINSNTTWKRGPTIPKSLEWNESQMDENNVPQGLQSILKGVTFKQKADNDVGGTQTFFNYEEPGVSPTILETLEFIRPAVEKGATTVGTIIATGSVGSLDDAEGIKTIFYDPASYNFLSVKNVWDKRPEAPERCCIFISEAYNMIGTDKTGLVEKGRSFMDKDGNTDIEFALAWIAANKDRLKNSTKKSELKQLALSQKCITPEEAFAERKLSEFPVTKLRAQQERILLKEKNDLWEFKPLKGLLYKKEGKTILDPNHGPEHKYPINPDWEDKRGCWTFYEAIPSNPPEGYTYYACVDSIEVDETETSHSVAAIDIFKTQIQVSYKDSKGNIATRIEGDKLVGTYRGRFKTPDETNEQMWLGIELFNAWTFAERNKPNFINYMRRIGKAERYLAKESDVPTFKDINVKNGSYANNSKYGFHMGDSKEIWKLFKAQAKEYFSTEYGKTTFEKNGVEQDLKIFTGIDRIDDYWLLEEFCQYVEGSNKNFDRLISFMGALFICKIYQQNRFIKKQSEIQQDNKAIENWRPQKSVDILGGGTNRNQSINTLPNRRRQSLI